MTYGNDFSFWDIFQTNSNVEQMIKWNKSEAVSIYFKHDRAAMKPFEQFILCHNYLIKPHPLVMKTNNSPSSLLCKRKRQAGRRDTFKRMKSGRRTQTKTPYQFTPVTHRCVVLQQQCAALTFPSDGPSALPDTTGRWEGQKTTGFRFPRGVMKVYSTAFLRCHTQLIRSSWTSKAVLPWQNELERKIWYISNLANWSCCAFRIYKVCTTSKYPTTLLWMMHRDISSWYCPHMTLHWGAPSKLTAVKVYFSLNRSFSSYCV